MKTIVPCFLFWALSSGVWGQQVPPQLYSEMDGVHFLDDGTAITFWGYGWMADGYITLPAPLLEYEVGEVVSLAFSNPSPESHTIHLHGLDVDQANDGVPTTSFYVMTGESTVYEFEATHSGTYLYHCHVTTTLHLTMGMYGMVLVTRPDGALFEGGPVVANDIPLLFSDLEVATTLDPVGSFPFHDIRPDVFMVNGLSGSQLDEPSEVVYASTVSPTALRLGSMAYSRVVCHFPEGLNAQLWMSDGRPVPSESLNALEIFPGERFTVTVQPDAGFDGEMSIEYWHMVDDVLEDVQTVTIRDEAFHPSGVELLAASQGAWHPNPAKGMTQWSGAGPEARAVQVWDVNGALMFNGELEAGVGLDVSSWNPGVYLAQVEGCRPTRIVVAE